MQGALNVVDCGLVGRFPGLPDELPIDIIDMAIIPIGISEEDEIFFL